MPIRLACVFFPFSFPNEKRNYVVPVKDVVDLPVPKGVDDFDRERLYTIRWPVLQRQNSETNEDQYLGKIRLLAATPYSMITQAAKASPQIRLPAGFLAENKRGKKSASVNDPQAVDMPRRASSRAKRQVNAALKQSCEKRMQEFIRVHKAISMESKRNSATVIDPSSNHHVPKTVSPLKPDTSKGGCSVSSVHDRKNDEEQENLTPVAEVIEVKSKLPHMLDSGSTVGASSNLPEQPNGISGSLPNKDEVIGNKSSSPRRRIRRKQASPRKSTCPSEVSYASTSAQKEELENRIIELQHKLTIERKKRAVAQTEAASLKLRLEHWEKAFNDFRTSVCLEKALSPGKKDMVDELKVQEPNNVCSPRIKNWVETSFQFSDSKSSKSGNSSPSNSKLGVCRKLYVPSPLKARLTSTTGRKEETCSSGGQQELSKNQMNSHEETSSAGGPNDLIKNLGNANNTCTSGGNIELKSQVSITGRKEKTCSPGGQHELSKNQMNSQEEISSAGGPNELTNNHGNSSETCTAGGEIVLNSQVSITGSETVGKRRAPEGCPLKVKKPKTSIKNQQSALGPNEKSGKELAPMILRALQGEETLQQNEKGKLLIGNNVFIGPSCWKRVKATDIKLSIMVKDLAEEIFGFMECANFSLYGGVSPKTPGAMRKSPPPAGSIEAIYGVFRAKKLFEGVQEERVGDYLKFAEGYLREKFAYSAKKLKRLKDTEQANQR